MLEDNDVVHLCKGTYGIFNAKVRTNLLWPSRCECPMLSFNSSQLSDQP